MKLMVVESNPAYIQFIKNPSEKLKYIAVKKNPYVIRNIINPSNELQMIALRHDVALINCINKPTDRAKNYCALQERKKNEEWKKIGF